MGNGNGACLFRDDDRDGIAHFRDPERGAVIYEPTAFLFDNIPGGVGLAERVYERAAELITSARLLIRGCNCDEGCPLCVGASEVPDGRRRRAALGLLERILSNA